MDYYRGDVMDSIRIALFASGTGTDANAILNAQENGKLSDCEVALLVSTKEEAPCINLGKKYNVETVVLPKIKLRGKFSTEVEKLLVEKKIDLVFLVGCIHRLPVLKDVPMYNIHPADTALHGGKGMYGIRVHQSVLDRIKQRMDDDIEQGISRWYTWITIHEVNEEYDAGPAFLKVAVEVFPEIDDEYSLQKRVLQYEWMILPIAINLAARRIRDKRIG
jgi:phosphoribosylglycinamide formyltransferase-1